MGFLIVSSNGESDLYSGSSINLIPDTLIEAFYQFLVHGGFSQGVVTLSPAWRQRLLEIHWDNFPEEDSSIPDNQIIQTILEQTQIRAELANHREPWAGIGRYQLEPVYQILSPIADVLYALQLGAIIVAMELVRRRDNGNFASSNLECQMLLMTCNMLKQLQPEDTAENNIMDLLDRFIVVYQNAVKTPDGFVTYS
jgi:hypothetical protein